MELDTNRPTDAEAWTYLVKHGDHITQPLARNVRLAIIEVLKKRWEAQCLSKINLRNFALIWLDPGYKILATKLAIGPAAEVFDIDTIYELKKCRLEGYWDVHLENGIHWLQMVFKESSRISHEDFNEILTCDYLYDYETGLNRLFWNGGEVHKESSRREEFLSHLSLAEYSGAYNTITRDQPNPAWDFMMIIEEIREYGEFANKIMLHVALWYDPDLKKSSSRQNIKEPIHHHLKEPFTEILSEKPHADASDDWESKALGLQRIVVDFSKENRPKRKGLFMANTLRFNQPPEVYHERFGKGTFWDRLAQKIHREMPEIPFRHPDLLPYNSTNGNIYHSDQRRAPSSTHPMEDVSSIVDLTTEKEGLVAPEIEDLIIQEYCPDTSSKKRLSNHGLRTSNSTGNKQTPSASTHTNHLAPGKDDPWAYTSPPPLPPGSTGLRKRKSPNGLTPSGSRRRKLVRLKLQQTAVVGETSTGPSASASDGQQSPIDPTPPPQRRKMNTNLEEDRESFRLPSQPPALTAPRAPMFSMPPEEIPPRTTEISEVEPPLSEGMQAPPPGVVSSAANRGEPLHSASQSAPAMTTEISQAGPLSSEIKQAMRIMLDKFADELNIEGQVASIQGQIAGISQAGPPLSNEVKQEVRTMLDEFVDTLNIEGQISDMIEQAVEQQVIADIRERVDKMEDQIIANKLIMEKQAAANELDINDRVTVINGQVVAIKEQADSTKEQVSAVKKQIEVDNAKEQVATIKKQVDTDRLNTEKQATAMNNQLNVMKKQADADKLAMNEQAATMEGQLNATIERFKSDTRNIIKQVVNKLDMKEEVDAIKKQVATIEGQVNADKLNMKEQVEAMTAQAHNMKEQVDAIKDQINADNIKGQVAAFKDQIDAMEEQVESDNIKGKVATMKEQVEADKLNMNEQVDAMKKQVEADKLKMEGLFNAEKLYMEEQVAAMKGQVDAMKVQFAAMNEQVASIKPTKISQPEAPSKTSLEAIDIVNEFFDELSMDDRIAVVDAVLIEHNALVFLRVSAGTRKAWLYRRIGINRDERDGTE